MLIDMKKAILAWALVMSMGVTAHLKKCVD